MQAHRRKPFFFSVLHDSEDFFQSHVCAVIDPAAFSGRLQQFRVDQRSRIYDDVRFLKKLLSTNCDEIRRSRSRSDKMDHKISLRNSSSAPSVRTSSRSLFANTIVSARSLPPDHSSIYPQIRCAISRAARSFTPCRSRT